MVVIYPDQEDTLRNGPQLHRKTENDGVQVLNDEVDQILHLENVVESKFVLDL